MINHDQRKSSAKNTDTSLSRRRFFRQTGAAIITTTLLTSCEGLIDEIFPKKNNPEGTGEDKPKLDQTLAFFGDSLTIGAGANVPYGTLVGVGLPGRRIVSDGIGGQIAKSIAIRQGGEPLTVTVEGGKFNGTEPLKVKKLSNEFLSTPINFLTYSRTGTLAGVKCTITREANEAKGEIYTIKPDGESIAEIPDDSKFVLDDPAELRTATQILWYGRNNIGLPNAKEDIVTALNSSVSYLEEPKRFLVLGVLLAVPEKKGTDRYNEVTEINSRLSSEFGKSFVPMEPPTEEEMAVINYSPSPEDLSDIANGIFPRGMRPDNADEIHINNKGYEIVANRVIAKLKELEY
ncbi:SGNH/GDSL hydrolase family protein [Dyadobacter sp. CY343]|uniref:SGNH/GDSL hydrolase family protein n=1 Tax=Dyadobacter sp. CY343 TaxID=2907299 RepID=UPI001F4134D9|nr:SGNH/GDSL hydrolase family protein [Dyadobacter sp. CY343]MCE7063295.1 SGNH/GDSL hydrolase family protein [Dyadobacter sp. CY343]